MASQPCDKCGIDVDPEIQGECPSCGRRIRAVAPPVYASSPEPAYDAPDWPPGEEQPDWMADQEQKQAGRAGGFLSSIGVRVLLGLLIFGGFSAWNAITSADRDDSGAIVEEGDVAANELRVGDCLQDPGDEVFEEVKGVSCDQAHDFEVFHVATVTGLSYPSDPEFEAAAGQHCLPAFDRYTGELYEDSELWIGYFVPDESAWSSGDRVMHCYLYLPGRVLVGSRAAG